MEYQNTPKSGSTDKRSAGRALLPDPMDVCGTPLTPTSYAGLTEFFYQNPCPSGLVQVYDFTNTHIVTMRETDADFRRVTGCVDRFIPDSMPVTWCVNLEAGRRVMEDRVYGPEFMRRCLENSPASVRHYFLGASEDCLCDLLRIAKERNPQLNLAGSHHGYFGTNEYERILADLVRADADLIWVGLGTPRQQVFADWLKPRLPRGAVLLVGFAFDVNAGRKKDAPKWMQRAGLTWLFRMASEPKRLFGRYVKYNSLFLFFAFRWFLGRSKR